MNGAFTLSTLKKDIIDTAALTLATPVLAIWSLASFLPFFQLFARGSTAAERVVEGVFLATGALGLGFLWAAAFFFMLPETRASFGAREKRLSTPLWLALFAAGWLASYAGYNVV